MDAASDLIWEHSYGAVTIDAICERAAVKKGSFYYFFDSKSDLAVAAISAWWEERKALLELLFRPEVPPLDRLRSYFDFVSQRQLEVYAATGQIYGCPLFTLGSEIATQDEVMRSTICEILATSTRIIEETIAEAQAHHEVEGTDPTVKARQLLAYYEGILTQARIQNNPDFVRNLSRDIFDLIGAKPQPVLAVA